MLALSSIPEILTATGAINSSGENTVIAAVTGKRINVVRYKTRTVSTVAVTISAKDSASGTVVDTDILQAPTSGVFGSNEAIAAPSYLFRTLVSGALILSLSGSISVTYSISYYLSDL